MGVQIVVQMANASQLRRAFLLSLALGFILAAGFLPAVRDLVRALLPSSELRVYLEMVIFPLTAFLFYVSLPRPKYFEGTSPRELFLKSLIPFLIAFAFGAISPGGSLFDQPKAGVLWYLLAIPLGEEFLFRGWMWSITERLWPNLMATATNPLPLPLWVSAVSFSLWHFQNIGSDPLAWVIFQILYTFWTGLWLGYLRWKSGGLSWPIVAHVIINISAGVW